MMGRFQHNCISYDCRKGDMTPKQLEGKRVGVALYTMTAAVFIRGLLQNEYGVDLDSITWVQGAIEKAGAHGSPTVPPLLKKVNIVNNTSGKSLSEMLSSGEIDVLAGATMPEGFGDFVKSMAPMAEWLRPPGADFNGMKLAGTVSGQLRVASDGPATASGTLTALEAGDRVSVHGAGAAGELLFIHCVPTGGGHA